MSSSASEIPLARPLVAQPLKRLSVEPLGYSSFEFGGANGPIHQILMGVAADCAYVEQLGSQQNATRQILNSWNSASTLFKVRLHLNSF